MLFYMQNKVQSIDNDEIVKICGNFYTEDHIWQEKTKFFTSIGKKPLPCRSGDKSKHLNNILQEIYTRDGNGDFQPTCVSVELSNIPQSDDGSVPNLQLLGTMHSMRSNFVTRDCFTTTMTSFKNEILLTLGCMPGIQSNLIPKIGTPGQTLPRPVHDSRHRSNSLSDNLNFSFTDPNERTANTTTTSTTSTTTLAAPLILMAEMAPILTAARVPIHVF